jgi:hypothetical protein
MTIAEIEAELAQLTAQIEREPRDYGEASQRRQALRRRQMLEAELLRMKRRSDLSEALRERLRRDFSASEVERLLSMDADELQEMIR